MEGKGYIRIYVSAITATKSARFWAARRRSYLKLVLGLGVEAKGGGGVGPWTFWKVQPTLWEGGVGPLT